jgi:hypothetical protein
MIMILAISFIGGGLFGEALRNNRMAVFASVKFIALLRKWKAKNSRLVAFEGSILRRESKRPLRIVAVGKNATRSAKE